ncbi:MAG: TetR/AcrR family transcriptional regulator [Lachnospiraceae bacterium]|nr:TetR/AcrR family transcriptional regulator [Lachnospiraceae bacterium]
MNEPKQDRRIRRTQKLLRDSLIELMQEKAFKNISVKDITERADLNRGTFYLHYNDTYQLLQSIEDEVLSNFQEMIRCYSHSFQLDTLLPVLNPVIDYISSNSALCRILFENTASTDFLNRFHRLINENGQEIIQHMFPGADPAISDCCFEFITYGLIGLIRQWLDNGQALPKAQLAALADRAVMGTADRLLREKEGAAHLA